jgi:hypothetical protein
VQYGRISQRGVILLQYPIVLPKAKVVDMRFGTWIRMIKSRRMRWTGYVARIERRGMHIGYWWGSQKERDH